MDIWLLSYPGFCLCYPDFMFKTGTCHVQGPSKDVVFIHKKPLTPKKCISTAKFLTNTQHIELEPLCRVFKMEALKNKIYFCSHLKFTYLKFIYILRRPQETWALTYAFLMAFFIFPQKQHQPWQARSQSHTAQQWASQASLPSRPSQPNQPSLTVRPLWGCCTVAVHRDAFWQNFIWWWEKQTTALESSSLYQNNKKWK